MKTATHHNPSHLGFSLMEMMLVISVLGVLCTLALAWFGNHGDDFRQVRDQRNAQSVCSVCQAVDAAGVDIVSEAVSTLEIVQKVVTGITVKKGVFKGRTFSVPNLADEEQEGAAYYLRIKDGQVIFNSDRATDIVIIPTDT